jgi:hypothetical protein
VLLRAPVLVLPVLVLVLPLLALPLLQVPALQVLALQVRPRGASARLPARPPPAPLEVVRRRRGPWQ